MGFRTMDDKEIAEFLAQPLVAVLAIDDPGWSPHVTPVWFHHLPEGNRFQVMTPAKSKKTRLHRTGSGELSLSIQTADGPTARYVNMQGVARFLPLDPALLQAMVTKYLPPEARAAYLANPPEDSMFDITPRRITTGVIG
ncbi:MULTISPECIES: pyridoxamine 5'-phosphate oxidase family protein [Kribbella]|uniref:Pyridoxamine 5'-phosphate oxidase N-terminal domain-containing protein n=1 Tax=Kribbella karoonensis TaxID=324851 RepID=A0ABN2D6Y5_9ACTN